MWTFWVWRLKRRELLERTARWNAQYFGGSGPAVAPAAPLVPRAASPARGARRR